MRWLFHRLPPPTLPPSDLRGWGVMVHLCPFAGLLHLVFIPLFYAVGVPQLAVFNVLSVAAWVVAWRLVLSGRLSLGVAIAIGEILAHAIAATRALGLEAGFLAYVIVTPIIVFVLNERLWLKAGSVMAACLTVIGLYGVNYLAPVDSLFSATGTTILAASNALVAASLVGIFGHGYSTVAQQLEQDVRAQHARSEELLHNILPVPIADRLKRAEPTIADRFEETTILFSDIVGFTKLSAKVTADELVILLNRIFCEIDALTDRYGLEKIKTIGDAYMVAAGLPEPRQDHAEAMASFALEMIQTLDDLREELGVGLAMRVGIHTGPVVAGVIGTRKFTYDMWGDSVNTASRMESHGEPGRVHVSQSTYERIRERFELTERGEIEIKGKGSMRTWFLEGRLTT